MLYLRSCIAGDAHAVAEVVRKPAKRCNHGDGWHVGAPSGPRIECNPWCDASPTLAARQNLQRGLRLRLQVFRKSADVGWGLRTLEFIPKGSFIMEYVGEHCSRTVAEARAGTWAETDVYLMEIGKGYRHAAFSIDALHARNVSAFANFACFPNMRKEPMLGRHWDSRLPHAAFMATRDIVAGEELTYRRDDSATTTKRRSTSRVRCMCGHHDCRLWV